MGATGEGRRRVEPADLALERLEDFVEVAEESTPPNRDALNWRVEARARGVGPGSVPSSDPPPL